ncbi:hypothetical protein TTHERM_01135130 (macronuclear) [Tetrahymena thermophila SB210]|uniref:Cell surface immobilization antigen n=1 Tax=Tetrahymena thermophila (strain SB210) TaxID=312017 RepID=Q235S6_TETTS|nr:hypothetical protein TTHERM_01135130 [Tetrahymena thermophila SB210]EAR92280.1 hypothetical protein TTHERM_01135130 [Tetrahymena thermophila SB210]|eukprot:XP_001012525.1 hypothetical protein TTHERM_01135130 [Tetrahymena thermophila SB210]
MNILKLLIVSLLVSQIFAAADATCTGTGCASPANCPAPPTVTPPLTMTWANGVASGKCALSACPTGGATFTGASDPFCQSCPGTPSGSVQAVFANVAGTACVAAGATCGAGRAANTWTNSDCLACYGNTQQYAKADRSACQANPIPGADATCTGTGCASPANCPAPPTVTPTMTMTWANGVASGKCALSACPTGGATFTGASDPFCQSCPGTPSGSVQAVFANVAGTACVAAGATCGAGRAANTWTNSDCLACYGNTQQYAKADRSACQANPIPGADATCTGTGCASPANCPAPPTVTPSMTLTWGNGVTSGKCALSTCPTGGATFTGASDPFCQSCPGTPSGSVQAVFANVAGTACVAAGATCGAGRAANTWTNSDCLACYGNTQQYAKADRSACQANPIPGADVTCTGSGCASPANCPAPPTVTPTMTLTWGNGVNSGKCALNTCPTGGATFTGATDLFCQSCPGTANGSVQAVFANTAGNACVAAGATCGNGRTANTWTNSDCLACNGNTSQYAKTDRSGCQATAPTSSSSSNSMIFLSSVLFLITFLF